MASPHVDPVIAIVPDWDPRPWRGTTVATWNGNNVVIPAAADLFFDLITGLNGRGAALTFQTALAAAKTGAGVWTAGIDSTDHVWIECDADDFTMSSGFEAFGFSSSGHGLVGGSAPYRRTAPNPWQRRPCVDVYGTIDPASSAAFTVPATTRRSGIQSPAIYLTSQGADPYDDTQGSPATRNLSYLLANCGAGRTEVHAYLDTLGHVVVAWSSNYAFNITMVDFDFWAKLGFDGTETRQALGLTTQGMRANWPCPGVFVTQDPPRRMVDGVQHQGSRVRLRSGEVVARRQAEWKTLTIEAIPYGPAAEDGADGDQHAHLLRHCLPEWYPGRRVNLYREVWDTRHAVTRREAAGLYDRFRTPEGDGARGRRAYYVAAPPEVIEYGTGLEYMAGLVLRLEEA